MPSDQSPRRSEGWMRAPSAVRALKLALAPAGTSALAATVALAVALSACAKAATVTQAPTTGPTPTAGSTSASTATPRTTGAPVSAEDLGRIVAFTAGAEDPADSD